MAKDAQAPSAAIPRRIVYVSGTRADYGLMRRTLRTIATHPSLQLSILVTGMHLSEEFGSTVKDIETDGFAISHRIDILQRQDSLGSMAEAVGTAIIEMTRAFQEIKPDVVLLEGDRGESLAAAISASHLNIAVAHISGGDVTGTMIDESIRHAITKFAHVHFPGTWLSAQRLLRMGEDPWRVHMVGTPGANLVSELDLSPEEVAKSLNIDVNRPILVVLQHPVSTQAIEAARQMRETMEAVAELREQTIVIYPNADAGGRAMAQVIAEYELLPHVRGFKSLPRPLYVALLSVASVLIGNSSSALTDAPNFGLPAVNIGTRQQGRERGGNILDVGYDRKEICEAIRYALSHRDDPSFQAQCRRSPYQDQNAGEQIAEVLGKVEIGPRLFQKRFYEGSLKEMYDTQAI